jgi:formylmethanofuran dehydrogenase subunit B
MPQNLKAKLHLNLMEMWQNCSMKVAPANLNIKTNTITATCPACGLLCDDVLLEKNINKINVLTKGCVKAVRFFEQPLNEATPLINGKSASLQQAIAHAARLIKVSQQPLFAGLSTDVQGFRAIYNLAQVTNGNLTHINAPSMSRNMKVLQSTGWQTTTLTEVKNRADVIVCFGDIATHNPRFFERFIDVDGMFVKAKNRQIIMFNDAENKGIIKGDALEGAWILACRAADMPSVTIALRALVADKALKATEIAGIKISDLQAVADKLKAAKYAVLAWVAKDLDFPHAELTIQNITETVAILNQTTRAAGLPLGGSDGDTTANNANTWLSGLALNDEHVEHDLMVWVNSFSFDRQPSESDKPLIVIGNSAPLPRSRAPSPASGRGLLTAYAAQALNPSPVSGRGVGERGDATQAPRVFIPIATPGLDCSGTLFRVDSSVILPLKKIRENDLPTLREVLSGIEALL